MADWRDPKWFMHSDNDDDDDGSHHRRSRLRRKAGKKLRSAGKETAKLVLMCGGLGLMLAFVIAFCFSCGTAMSDAVVMALAYVYQSDPDEINAAEEYFCDKENEMYRRLANIQSEFPGYDEYSVDSLGIGHDAFELISYLSAKLTDFKLRDAKPVMDEILAEKHTLITYVEQEERIRYVPVTYEYSIPYTVTMIDADGNTYTETHYSTGYYISYEPETYIIYRLYVSVPHVSVEQLAIGKMNEDQREQYDAYQECHGGVDSIPIME